jgi:lysophospholipase L1-like esterase
MALYSNILSNRARAEKALADIENITFTVEDDVNQFKNLALSEIEQAKNAAIDEINNSGGGGTVIQNPIISDPSIQVAQSDEDSIRIDYTIALDNQEAQADLIYSLYVSDTNNLNGTIAEVEANGSLASQQQNANSLIASNLNVEQIYYFCVIVEDLDGNKSRYNTISGSTTDLTAPTLTNNSISFTNIASTSLTVNFFKATDAISAQSTLTYKLYRSTSNNITTVLDMKNNGTLIRSEIDVALFNISGLSPETDYYFNIIVEDEAGNETGYAMATTTTVEQVVGSFASTAGAEFVLNSTPTKFIGTNAYYAPNYMKINPSEVTDVLDECQTIGINLTRTWGFYDGPAQYANDISLQPNPGEYSTDFQYLDQFIAECKSRGIYVIISLVNYWEQLGGIEVYNGWAGDPEPATDRMRKFINGTQQQTWFRNYISNLLNRTNSVTGVQYKYEEHIFAWEIGNELRNPADYSNPAGGTNASRGDEIRDWYQEIAQFIKGIDPNHMVTTGEEGFDEGTPAEYTSTQYSNTYVLRAQAGTSFVKNTAIPEIDFAQSHWYPDVFGLQRTFDGTSQQLLEAQQDQQVFLEDRHVISNSHGKPFCIGEWGIEDWDSSDNYLRKELGYQHFYSVVELLGIESHLLWQYVPNFGEKWGEFGGNIAFPGRASDEDLYDDFAAHISTALGMGDAIDPTVSSGLLTFDQIQSTSIRINFAKATDNQTPQTGLRYRLYRSTSNNLDTIANTKANGTFIMEETNVDAIVATGLNPSTTYYFNVIVLDASGNESLYTANTEDTIAISPSDVSIMMFGDSLTNDSRGRVQLWNQLVGDGHTIDYVGSLSQTSSIPDPDHEGLGGRTIQEGADVMTARMTTYDPEYVTLLLGTNDFAWYFDETAAQIATRHQALVNQIIDNSPSGTTVVVCTLPPVSSATVGQAGLPERDRQILAQNLNNEIRSYVATMKGNGDPVQLADLEAVIDFNTDMSGDGVHLAETGYTKYGNVLYNAMNTLLTAGQDTVDPTVSNGALSFNNVASTSLDVNFNKATDDISAQNTLSYKLYRSLTNNISNVADAESNGTLVDTQTDVASFSVTGLTPNTTYFWQVVVEDEAGNTTAYTSSSQATTAAADTTEPVISNATLATSGVTSSAFDVDFAKATDETSSQANLEYKLYTSLADNISTPANAVANGTLQDSGFDVIQLTVSGLSSATVYYYVVTVQDEGGNVSIYTSNNQSTASSGIPTLNADPITTDLRMYHDFYEQSGIVVNDLANSNDIDLDYGYDGACPWVTFDGETCVEVAEATANVAAIADSADMQPSGDFTFGLRFGHTETWNSIGNIFDMGGNPNGISILPLGWNDEYGFRIGSQIQYISIPVNNDSQLHTLVFSLDTSDDLDWLLTVYLDGTVVVTDLSLGEQTGSINNFDTHLWIGSGPYTSPDVRGAYTTWWNKIALWHRALTPTEVSNWSSNPDIVLS